MEADPLLRRIGCTAMLLCAVMAAMAFALSASHLLAASAVLGGGLLAGMSALAIHSGVDALVQRVATSDAPIRRPALHWTVVKVTGRYALLAFTAYVMIARLRLPPVGLLAGASSIVAAVALEAARLFMKKDSAYRT